jgi:predicted CopG family antitoxin
MTDFEDSFTYLNIKSQQLTEEVFVLERLLEEKKKALSDVLERSELKTKELEWVVQEKEKNKRG